MGQSQSADKNSATSTTWSVMTRYFVLALIIAAFIWVGIIVAPLLQAIGIAILLALLLNPVVHWVMRRTRLQRSWAAGIVFVALLLTLAGISIGMGSLAVAQVTNLSSDLFAAADELQTWIFQPINILGFRLELTNLLTNLQASFGDTLATLPRGSLNLLSNFTTNLLWMLTIVVTLFYFLKDGPRIKPWIIDHLPPGYQPEIAILLEQVEEVWGRFLRIQLLLFVVLVVLLGLGTLLVVWLFRSGLLRWSLLGFILLLVAVYTAVQQVDNLWLRPQYMGRHLQLHPGIVFVGLIAGLAFGGLLGALVVVPAIATARIVGRYLYNKILGIPPWEEQSPKALNQDTD